MITYTIYVVDDEETITQSIKIAIETDYRVVTFDDAETAIDAIKKDPPDLVLLDIGLPGMSGVEALGEIKHLYPDMLSS